MKAIQGIVVTIFSSMQNVVYNKEIYEAAAEPTRYCHLQ